MAVVRTSRVIVSSPIDVSAANLAPDVDQSRVRAAARSADPQ